MSDSTHVTYLPYVLDAATCAIGSLLIYSGVKGTFIDPLAWAKGFGLPTATPENVVLFPSATGRNLGAGIFVWAMILLREREILGIFLMCWQDISMDFITYPEPSYSYGAVLVIVDRLTNMKRFIPCKDTCNAEEVTRLYIRHV
ncbi:hypothetical protein N7499_009528 [Penicillium canescens]|uniref:Uncharacterized protein n=1 Tax=Penicillium canescens TaxID=5083 RepID=A0AAD6INA5_PENCN|nr:uncharacterized protein N7446_008446 [Penicillium canescens]KAJ6019308.1 hypothetical protein N7522_001375 [Penicillium canescens]KAJ6033263.1 hypothetical protein N7444_011034 [Penicillium canescens]KAJ6057547.1 hypothetical protein N7460_000821 [Penicillium canescens]KAJ6058863.1 hypothetical protein N7446_008446 [Penicillium canescens]KAJ6071514.1 hypothetical protein N7499_009528 [Penicillium canescens]